MDIVDLAAFAIPLATACAVPGPTTMMLVARVTAQGTKGIGLFCLGLIIGDILWLLIAVAGASALAASAAPVFEVIRWLGAAYLFYVAWQLWSAPADGTQIPRDSDQPASHLFWAGLLLALGNAKTGIFYVALVPTFLPLEPISLSDVGALSVVVVAIYGSVLGAYVLAALRTRRLFFDTTARKRLNRIAGGVIAISAIFVISI